LIYATVGLGFTIGAASGPVLAGYIFDMANSHTPAFLIYAIIATLGLYYLYRESHSSEDNRYLFLKLYQRLSIFFKKY